VSFRIDAFKLEEFRAALSGAGAELLELTNEWEVIRYRLEGKVGIVYRNKKGRITPSGAAGTHHANWKAGRPLTMSKGDKKRERRASALQLFTDASQYQTTGAAAWAAILVDADGVEHEAHGPLKGEIGSSTAAEARAVANALHHFASAGLLNGDVRVVCDNQAVVDYIRSGKVKHKREQIHEALQHILKVKTGRFTLFADWVKGHQSAKAAALDKRAAYNRRCDALAKAHARTLDAERREAAWAHHCTSRHLRTSPAHLVKALQTETVIAMWWMGGHKEKARHPPERAPGQNAGAEIRNTNEENPMAQFRYIRLPSGRNAKISLEARDAIRRMVRTIPCDKRAAHLAAAPHEGVDEEIVAAIRRRMISNGELPAGSYTRRNEKLSCAK